MNNDTKVIELREKGYGYKRIANELNLTRDQVRYICLKTKQDSLDGICKNCDRKIKSVRGKKKKVYCSDKCRYKWWNKQKKLKRKNEEN